MKDQKMEGRTVYGELLRLLKTRSSTIEDKGIEIEIKRIPDSDREGDLDPRVLKVLGNQRIGSIFPESIRTGSLDLMTQDIENIRASMGWPNIDVTAGGIHIEERTIPGTDLPIPIRIYSPGKPVKMPAVVFFHGGGFIGGTVKAVENPCKALAEKAGAVVVSVDYRLAPEYPFPAGLTDCFDSVAWVHANAHELNIDEERMTVAGDSAGGNLSVACAIMDRDRKTRMIALQALIYPTVDLVCRPCKEYTWDLSEYNIRHHRELIEGIISALRGDIPLLASIYLQGHDSADPLVSPLYVADASGLAPTLILTAEYDALRLEAEAFARKLTRDSVRTRLIRYNGMDHAFMDKIGLYPQAEDCIDEIAAEVCRLESAGAVSI
jgi:acetyl esterase/lipase